MGAARNIRTRGDGTITTIILKYYEYEDYNAGCVGNIDMTLEKGESQQNHSQQADTDDETIATIETTTTDDMWHKNNCKIPGERDPLLNRERQ